jgi:putative acetyltransferase
MHLRAFRNDDLPDVIAVFRDAIYNIASSDYDAEQLRVWAQVMDDVDEVRARLCRGKSVIAEDDLGVVAFGQLHPDDHINYLYCRKRGRGKGYAACILHHLEAEAARPGVRVLHTEASLTARRFFAKHGYTVVGEELVVRYGIKLGRSKMQKLLIGESVEGQAAYFTTNMILDPPARR